MPAVVDALSVCSVHNPDERVCLLKVVLPVRPQRLLPANVPSTPFLAAVALHRGNGHLTDAEFVSFIAVNHSQPMRRPGRQFTYPSYSIVLMMNPSVGLTLLTSSFMMRLTMVVFPALSRPLPARQPPPGMPSTSLDQGVKS